MFLIRAESPADLAAIYDVNRQAFGGRDAEPRLVNAVRASPGFIPELSLVAEEQGKVIGHILFSRIEILAPGGRLAALSLAPLAVLPGSQNQGVGSALVRRGLDECRRLGHAVVIVLGHPAYYPRFGFSAALARSLDCPFGDAGDAWMAIELVPGALNNVNGRVVYPPAFDGV